MSFFLLLNLIAQVYLVQANVECILQSYSWAYNKNDMSPCDVAWSLIKECDSSLGDMLPLRPNAPNTHTAYYGITNMAQTPCLCNTITYSLISACGLCQDQSYMYWSEWASGCGGWTSLYQYNEPIPPGLDVPSWAYMDVTTINYFNALAAFRDASATRLLLAGSSTLDQSLSLPTPASLPPSNSTSNAPIYNITNTNVNTITMPDSKKDDKVDIPTLIGAITGAISGIVVLTLAILKYRAFRRAQKRKAQNDTEKHELVGKADEDWPEEEDDIELDEHGIAVIKFAKTEH